MRCKLLFIVLSVFITTSIFSQGNDSLKAQLIQDWERAKAYTKAYLDAMPAEKYSYRAVDSTVAVFFSGHCIQVSLDRKSTRLNSSHLGISYAVFCLKK